LFLQSPSYSNDVREESVGIAVPNINASKLASLKLPLPPVAEQRRIVAKVETLLAGVTAARERLSKVSATLKCFRQAVLAAACSGRLTKDWRALHRDEAQPSLPNRFASPRRTRRGANLSSDELLVDDDLPELPPSWIYARADSVVAPKTVITYGIVLPGPEVPNGIPYVRQQDISDEGIHVGELRHTSTEIASKHGRSQLQPDDVLLCIIRNLRVAIVPPEIAGANITQGTVRLRPSEAVMPRFLAMWLKAPPAQGWMKRRYFGMDMPRINVEDARAVPVGLPPVSEQQEIVRRVDALLALADMIEKQVAAATGRADRLPPSILAKAFRGELVPTEAELAHQEGRSYEPASVLLERIRSFREDANAGSRHGGGRKRARGPVDLDRDSEGRPRARRGSRHLRRRSV
jgi:type I restriction enzyme S subunit